jgi:KipI family sensor histidine kinase inhibitor
MKRVDLRQRPDAPIDMNLPPAEFPRVLPNGDAALTVEFGRDLDETVNRRVLAFDRAIATKSVDGIVETVPTYRSLLIHYDPLVVDYATLRETLLTLAAQPLVPIVTTRRWRVPVVYGGEFGIDLEDVAKAHDLTPDDVVNRHMSGDYFVAMVGFTPGFCYLSGLDPALATSRRKEPRAVTPPGSIHIGGAQAAIQCLAGPSGWHLLGRTPVRTFHPARDPVFLIAPGDAVTFYAISADQFAALDSTAARGEQVAELVTP